MGEAAFDMVTTTPDVYTLQTIQLLGDKVIHPW